MDPRDESVAGPEEARQHAQAQSDDDQSPPDQAVDGGAGQGDAGQSSGSDVLTLSLFGVMVIIASVCLVIW